MKMDWNVSVSWTVGGDFVVYDEDEDSPVITVTFHDVGVRRAMLNKEDRKEIAGALAQSIVDASHPFELPPEHPAPDHDPAEE